MNEKAVDQELDLSQLFRAFIRAKWMIISITSFFAIISLIVALNLPDIYRSDTLLAPAGSQQQSPIGALGQLGGLASLAGINIGEPSVDKTALALEILRSRDFIGRFIEKYDLFVPLMASKEWDLKSNKLVIDDDIYNESTKTWVREVSPPLKPKPSLQEAYEKFLELMQIQQSKDNGMVTLSIEHYSPYIAQEWVSLLITELNLFMKRRDMQEAQRSMSYLEQQLKETQVEELRSVLFQLIEEQTKTLMLTQVTDEYAFKVIDPPIVSEKKAKPSRALICILSTLFGGFFACFLVFIKFLYKPAVRIES